MDVKAETIQRPYRTHYELHNINEEQRGQLYLILGKFKEKATP